MSGIGLTPPLQSLGVELALVPILLVVLSGGLVGMSIRNMFDSILSDDEDAVDASDAGGAPSSGDDGMTDGGLMAEDGDDFDEFGGLDDGDDDGFDDDFGGDEFGDMDDAGGSTDELEHRLDELENEVGSLSSTVNTVRTENEQISESVEDVQENVRKLLDIYEMVTRGVNPFADDIETGMGGGMGEGSSFGLFDDDGGGGGGDEEGLDDDIAAADAEGFFDEDLVDDGDDEFDVDSGDVDADDVFDAEDDLSDEDFDDEFEDDFDEGDLDGEDLDEGGGGEGGKSFQELKDEYDSGDAEWADGEAPEDAAAPDEDEDQAEAAAEMEGALDEPEPTTADGSTDLADDELFDEVIEDEGTDPADEPAAAETTDPAPAQPDPTAGAENDDSPEAPAETNATTDETSTAADAGKPYLATLPGGFAGDLIVVEWLEYLTERSSYRAVDDAIDYYERIDWISPAVADELRSYLRGFDAVEGDGGSLTIDDHTQSLQYISQLDGDGTDAAVLSRLGGGGGSGLFG